MLRPNRKIAGIFFLAVLICFSAVAFAAKKQEIPPWMENIDDTGRSNYLVPKGAKREVVGSQVLVEAPNEYTARRLYEMENYLDRRFEKIEEDQKNLTEALNELKESIEKLGDISRLIQDVERLAEDMGRLEARLTVFETAQEEPKESAAASDASLESLDEPEVVDEADEEGAEIQILKE